MRYLGLDLGTKTLGIAISDKSNLIASSLEVLRFLNEDYDSLLEKVKLIVLKYQITTIVLGLPKNMNNTLGKRAEDTIKFKEKLSSYLNIEVVLEDERLSTVLANTYMYENNYKKKQKKKQVDSVAACVILQTYLDRRKEDKNER